jgi:polyisoprenoid-binding protein YceI
MKTLLAIVLSFSAATALATPATYQVDPDHTFPHFETDHMGGLSVWRGLFKETTGVVVLDKEAKTGSVDITIKTATADLGLPQLNKEVIGPKFLDTAKYPTATYVGKLTQFEAGAPTTVEGNFTLHGVTKPLKLKINSFKCIPHPLNKRELCGADAIGTFNRDDFDVGFGKQYGFKQEVALRIQIEALKQD